MRATGPVENSPQSARRGALGRVIPPGTIQQGVLKNPPAADTGTGLARPWCLMRGTGFSLTILAAMVLAACSVVNNPTQPGGGSSPTGAVVYSALGASDANGVGSSAPCFPYVDCPDGTGYVPQLVKRYKAAGRSISSQNLGVAGATLSKTFQDIGNRLNRNVLINLVDDEMPFIKTDATLVTVFTGGNDANAVADGAKKGFGGSSTSLWIDTQIATFARDLQTLVAGVKKRAPNARILMLNLPNFAAMPYAAGLTLGEKQALQYIAVSFNAEINKLAAQGAIVVDLMCETRTYERGNISGDGFHPNDSGYAMFADLLYVAATASAAAPKTSCAAMSYY